MTSSRSCVACLKGVPDDAAFCPSCGTPTPTGQTPASAAAPSPPGPDRAVNKDRLQKVLGETYQLKEMIGLGGFAEVYSAWDPRLKREVAVKVIRADLAPTASMLERFRREAEAVATLRHPNIIPIYTVGEGDGLVFFVMPLVKGESLAATLLREKRLSIAETRRILVEAAAGLSEAHEAGLVHRDIKPENIMLEGRQRRVLLMDFGIAKAITGGTEGGGLTMTGMIIGTPQYMSPEQAGGERTIDARSDQYSLAIVAYRMLTGDLPFDAKTPAQLVFRQIAETPKPVHELVPEVPHDLSDALGKALAKDPADRFANMEAFAAAVAAGAPVATGSATPSIDTLEREIAEQEARRPALSRPLLAAGVLGLLTFAGLYALAYPTPLSAPRDTRAQALARGRDFLGRMGAVGSFTEQVVFEPNNNVRGFLERVQGRDELERRVLAGMPLGEWHMRWLHPGTVEHWKAMMGAGVVTGFEHVLPEAAPGANLPPDSARLKADAFLAMLGWSPDSLRLLEASSATRSNRTDHHFVWEKIGSALQEQKGDSVIASGAVRVTVDVAGDQVSKYRNAFELRTKASSDPLAQALADGNVAETVPVIAAMVICFAFALGYTISRARARDVRWRPALIVSGVFAAGSLVASLNQAQVQQFQFPAASARALYWGTQGLSLAFATIFLGGGMLILAAPGEALGRLHQPRLLAGYHALLRGAWRDGTVSRAIIRGYALAFLLAGVQVVIRVLGARIPGARVPDSGYTSALNDLLPALLPLTALTGAVTVGLLMLFSLSALTRLLKTPWLVLGLVIVLGGFVQPAIRPYLLGVAFAAAGVSVLVLVGIRLGVVAMIVGSLVSTLLVAGVGLLRAPETAVVAGGVVALVAAFVPALVVVRGRAGLTRPEALLGALALVVVAPPAGAQRPIERADAHVHLSLGAESDLDSLLARGVTVVRDAGGDHQQLTNWRAEIAAGARRGPRLLIAGPIVDGHKPGATHRLTVATVADAEAAVDSLARLGVDFIKTHNAVPPEAFFAIIRRARLRGLRVAAHLPRGVPAWIAADSGVGSIEHAAESLLSSPIYAGLATDGEGALRWWESAAGDSALRRLARSGVTIVPTLVRYEAAIAAASTADARNLRAAALPRLQRLVGRMHRAGIPILVGSDLVGLPGSIPAWAGPAREIELLVASGLTVQDASAAASAGALLKWFQAR